MNRILSLLASSVVILKITFLQNPHFFFLSFHEQTRGGGGGVQDDQLSILESLQHPLFA